VPAIATGSGAVTTGDKAALTVGRPNLFDRPQASNDCFFWNGQTNTTADGTGSSTCGPRAARSSRPRQATKPVEGRSRPAGGRPSGGSLWVSRLRRLRPVPAGASWPRPGPARPRGV
jgi:hypothetical protein